MTNNATKHRRTLQKRFAQRGLDVRSGDSGARCSEWCIGRSVRRRRSVHSPVRSGRPSARAGARGDDHHGRVRHCGIPRVARPRLGVPCRRARPRRGSPSRALHCALSDHFVAFARGAGHAVRCRSSSLSPFLLLQELTDLGIRIVRDPENAERRALRRRASGQCTNPPSPCQAKARSVPNLVELRRGALRRVMDRVADR